MHIFAEGSIIVTDIVKTCFDGYGTDRKICIAKQSRTLCNAKVIQVINRGQLCHFFN